MSPSVLNSVPSVNSVYCTICNFKHLLKLTLRLRHTHICNYILNVKDYAELKMLSLTIIKFNLSIKL